MVRVGIGALVAVALVGAGCGGADRQVYGGGATQPGEPDPPSQLEIEIAGGKTYSLACSPVGGSLPSPTAACDRLAARTDLLAAVEPCESVVATGPAAVITGTWRGRHLDLSFTNCPRDRERWAALTAALGIVGRLLPPPPTGEPSDPAGPLGRARPPQATVTTGAGTIQLRPNTYCWSMGGAGVCADGIAIACGSEWTPEVAVSVGETVTVDLGFVPSEVVIDHDGRQETVAAEQHVPIAVGDKLGVVSVFAKDAKRGDVFYGLCLTRA